MMNSDVFKAQKLSSTARRGFRRLSTEEEIELKRARGEVSCAECRRLKLKCDKRLPCSSCIRRGCPTICPNGSLSTGQGARYAVADTEHLHRKIAEMGQRIRQLEDALAILQAGVSNETHPLLADDLLAVKLGPEVPKLSSDADPSPNSIALDVGTLTIGDDGESKYFGRSGGSETLLLAGAELDISSHTPEDFPELSAEVQRLNSSVHIALAGSMEVEKFESVLNSLIELLPPYPRASALCETYLEHAACIFRPIHRDELFDDILSPIYKAVKEKNQNEEDYKFTISPHKLAVVFMIFAHGALMDLTLPPYNSEAENYFYLSRFALSLRPAFDLPTIETVQATALMSYYHANGGNRYSLDSAWSLISFASKLGQSMGLHRDPSRWNMDPKTTQRRRTLFWEIFTADLYHSLALGRPPSNRLSYIDTEFPQDDSGILNEKGEREPGFWHWKYLFTRDVFMQVTELTLTAAPPSYETILDLDRKVRENHMPCHLNRWLNQNEEYGTPSDFMRGRLLSQFRSTTMMYIHRSYFAQAMLDYPSNPLRSPYAPSFLAAYRCASAVIKATAANFERFPDLVARWWTIWTHLFSSAVIVGSIVTRAPASTMAPAAWAELCLVVDLFSRGVNYSPRARSGMAILTKLQAKARTVYAQYRSGNAPSAAEQNAVLLPEIGGEDELAMFGGQTRILASRILSRSSRRKTPSTPHGKEKETSSPTSSPPTSMSDDTPSPAESVPEVHPSLVQFLSSFSPPTGTGTASAPATMSTFDSSVAGDYTASFREQMDFIASIPPTNPFAYPLTVQASFATQQPVQNSIFDQNLMYEGYPTGAFLGPAQPPIGQVDQQLYDINEMLAEESGMDDQWMSFMKQSGILEESFGDESNA